MYKNPDHDREEVPGRPAVSRENTRRQAGMAGRGEPKRGGGIQPRGYVCASDVCLGADE